MKMTAKTSKYLKRILGLAVPSLIMLIAIIMVSVSFAWFSTDVKPSVQSIKLTVGSAFTLSFENGESSASNINYKGQTAIDANGRLITDYNGREHTPRPNNVELNQYLLDTAYYFITTIKLDTDATTIKMSMDLDSVKIKNSAGDTIVSYGTGDGNAENGVLRYSPDDVPYAFTWYFKEHESESNPTNYTGSVTEGGEDNRVMKYPLPSAGEVWYTPYGMLKFGDNGLISEINGETEVNGESVADGYSLIGHDANNGEMQLLANNTEYDFYIVFAPEKLYWAQYCKADRELLVTDSADGANDGIYSSEELVKIFGASSKNRMYYSNTAYYGSTFVFGATLRVAEIGDRTE